MAIEICGMAPLLEVFDMPTSLAFYRDKLGFKVTGDSGQGDESGTVMLNTAYDEGERPESPGASRVAAHSDTCIYFGCQDIDAAFEHLKTKGVICEPPSVAPYGMKQLYLRDPDNYSLCFQWPEK